MSQKKPKKPSETAVVAAAVRATHLKYDKPVIMNDPYAQYFLNGVWRMIGRWRWLYILVTRVLLKSIDPIRSQVLIRSRFAEELFRAESGLLQCVILGSGYDTLALRSYDCSTQFFEVDMPQVIDIKQQIIDENKLNSNAIYVKCDFKTDNMIERLKSAGYDASRKTLFIWLGVTYYLPLAATRQTLAMIQDNMSNDSKIYMDYGVDPEILDAQVKYQVNEMKNFVAKRGEPMVGFINPDIFKQTIDSLGLKIAQELGGDEMKTRYLQGSPLAFSGFSKLVVMDKK